MKTTEVKTTTLVKTSGVRITRHHYTCTSSTQDIAEEITPSLTDNRNDWLLVTADEQTKGRATHNRSWTSPPNVNIYATYIFPFPKPLMSSMINIPQLTAFSVLLTLEEFGFKPTLKWINDVLVDKKKICGILSQSEFPPHLEKHLAIRVGVGINVNMSAELCDSLDQPVTSLLVSSGKTFDKEVILGRFQENFQKNIELFIKHGFAYFSSDIAKKMEFLNENIKVTTDGIDTVVEGIMRGIDAEGALLLETGRTATGPAISKLITGHIMTKQEEAISLCIAKQLYQQEFPETPATHILQYLSTNMALTKSVISSVFTTKPKAAI